MAVTRLARFRLVTWDAERLGHFYQVAIGARPIAGGVAVGEQIIELRQPEPRRAPYPADTSVADPIFQHFAIVTNDMAAAWRRLSAADGWSPISTGGPVRLPASSGGVIAVKFRDPEGHPLELLEFPGGRTPAQWQRVGSDPCLGIDHSAISVADTTRSIAFYQALGFRVTGSSINRGPEQARLDGIAVPDLEVTALAPEQGMPHLELLCYRSAPAGASKVGDDDVAATVLVTEGSGSPGILRDPDGHRLLI